MGQSTNDVFPTATRLALLGSAPAAGRGGARARRRRSTRKAREFADVLKTGRTHLQDAVPMTLGQEFGGYAACVAPRRRRRRARRREQLRELNLGATAVGTGLNAGDDYRRAAIAAICARTPACRCVPRGEPLPRHAEHGRRRSRTRARCAGSRSRSARSPATCGCSAWGRAPGSPRSRCRRCSPDRRSCRAR